MDTIYVQAWLASLCIDIVVATNVDDLDPIILIALMTGVSVVVINVGFICIICCVCVRRSSSHRGSTGLRRIRSRKSKSASITSRESHVPSNNYISLAKRKTMEFPRNKINLLDRVGSGAFADVYKAEAYGIIKLKETSIVAVKVLKEYASEKEKTDFKKELVLFGSLGEHENLVAMYGCCTESDPMFLIMEYLPHGNLQGHLRMLVERSQDDPYSNRIVEHSLSPEVLLKFGIQIARGMEFLDSKKCIHRDLATRNILLGECYVCKISDFGLARDVASTEQYEKKSKGRIPVRWMAPEALVHNTYTIKSDAWSFGILMWEIITLGSHPYPGMSPREVIRSIQNGYRMAQPDHCNDEIYNLLLSCWEHNPEKRPIFTQIRESLENMIERKEGYLNMDSFSQDKFIYLDPDVVIDEEC